MSAEQQAKYSVPVSGDLDAQVKADMEAEGFGSVTEYVRSAIREKLERSAKRRLEAKLLEAVERGDYREGGPELFDKLRRIARGGDGPANGGT